jgi:hypothetical protein
MIQGISYKPCANWGYASRKAAYPLSFSMNISKDRLRALFEYDPATGSLISKQKRSSISVGDACGHIASDGYVYHRVDGKEYLVHRLIWVWHFGEIPIASNIDHINGIKNDNRIANLRLVTQAENQKNKRLQKNNTSGFNGVSWDGSRNKWRVQISLRGHRVLIGEFSTKSAAIRARKQANLQHGFHQNHGRAAA